ncbi:MAG TPA: AAA family ATPase [Candidatus Dormibacteraeota bacterium]|nr:AAA family ATPase [Candidatus Dormibacteraeota bacterium]
MYKRFYNLQRNPFDITPDPSFLFLTRKHNEALAALYYGVKRRKGFVVLTGEVGTGKTVLVRCMLQILNRANISYAYVFNPVLSAMEFLQYVAGDLRLSTAGKNKSELLLELSTYAIARYQKGLTTVLVVDEAHHLSTEVLEEIRLLTNLETRDAKLLQILLVGQPELDEKLDSVDLRQLKQRVALRSHLGSLDLEETSGYVYRRMQIAGSTNPAEVFPVETIAELHRQSRGYPRLINTLCENALIHGYASQTQSISPEVIEEIAADFRLNVVHPGRAERDKAAGPSTEVAQAAQTLLDLYQHLQNARENRAELRMIVGAGARKNEPYI